MVVGGNDAEAVLREMRKHPLGKDAAIIGEIVAAGTKPACTLNTEVGGTRIVDMLTGAQLPRIC